MIIDNIIYKKDLIIELLKKELKVRYKNSFLGYFWSVAMPLSLAITYYYAFKFVMKINIENYALFLIIGLFPWQWFANSVMSSANVIIGNSSLIKKTTFPKEALIYATVLNDLIHYLFSLPVIFIFMLIYNIKFTYTIIFYLPITILLQFFLTMGISFIVSSLNVFFRDLERLVLITVNLLFYITPILYDQSMVPEKYRALLIYFNPFFPLIEIYREIFLKGGIDFSYLGICFIQTLIMFTLGFFIFKRLKWKFAELL